MSVSLEDFAKWVKANTAEINQGFYFHQEKPEATMSWFGEKPTAQIKKAVQKLDVFGTAPDGSSFAIWSKSETERPIVLLESEGKCFALAENLEDFLRLLALPYDFALTNDYDVPPDKESGKTDSDFLKWLKTLKLKPAKTGSEIIDPAQEKHADFYGWIQEITGAKSDSEKPKSEAPAQASITAQMTPAAFSKLELFDKLVCCLGRRIDDPLVTILIKELGAKPLKATNPRDPTGSSAAKNLGIEISTDCNPKIRHLWPTRKEGKLYVTYVTCFWLDEKFKNLPFDLAWNSKKITLQLTDFTEVKNKWTEESHFEKPINSTVTVRVSLDEGVLKQAMIYLNEEKDHITTSADSETEKPLAYVEDAFFAAWCALNGFLNKEKFTPSVLDPLLKRKQTPLDFLNDTCGPLLWEKDFAQDKAEPLLEYYDAMTDDPDNYRSDIEKTFKGSNHFRGEPSEMTQNTWENFDKIAKN